MELNLKQTEIEAALRQYVSNQGFDLAGRAVTIAFTSGRTPAGLSALIDIGDVTEVPKSNPPSLNARSAELRTSDVQLGAVATAQTATPVHIPGGDLDEAVEPDEPLMDPGVPDDTVAVVAGDAPVSLFAKPTH